MSKLQEIIHRKRLAYLRTFCDAKGDPHQSAQTVLADLKRFCGINRGGIVVSPISRVTDPYATIYRAAQRDVYLRIVGYLGLDENFHTEDDDNGRSSTADTE